LPDNDLNDVFDPCVLSFFLFFSPLSSFFKPAESLVIFQIRVHRLEHVITTAAPLPPFFFFLFFFFFFSPLSPPFLLIFFCFTFFRNMYLTCVGLVEGSERGNRCGTSNRRPRSLPFFSLPLFFFSSPLFLDLDEIFVNGARGGRSSPF